MTQAKRVHSTPPTNTSATIPTRPVDPTRRGFIALAAGAGIIVSSDPESRTELVGCS